MEEGKGEYDYDLAIAQAAYFAGMYTGELKIDEANPYRKVGQQMSPELKELKRRSESESGMMGLEAGLCVMMGRKPSFKRKDKDSTNGTGGS